MRFFLLLAVLAAAAPATAQPVVKILNFTADWCPNCQVLNPKIDRALADFDGDAVALVDLDLTATRGGELEERAAAREAAGALAAEHGGAEVWADYASLTGLAVAIAADTGEPLACFTPDLSGRQISGRLLQATIIASRPQRGERRMNRPPRCPPPRG
ncbi:MAG: thioredoxin family protein [Pseudomonadota bacterium]